MALKKREFTPESGNVDTYEFTLELIHFGKLLQSKYKVYYQKVRCRHTFINYYYASRIDALDTSHQMLQLQFQENQTFADKNLKTSHIMRDTNLDLGRAQLVTFFD